MRTQATQYDQDFYAWTQAQAALLREGALQDLDVTNIAEEIESLGTRDRREALRRLRRLMQHLLKWQYQPGGRQTGHSWRSTIQTQRAALADLAEESPTLAQEFPGLLTRGYPLARQWASDETRWPLATFPATCPWTLAQVLDADFWPGAGQESPPPLRPRGPPHG